MDVSLALLIVFGVALIIVGLFQQSKDFARWNIKFFNSLRGVKTDITPVSLTSQKFTGIVFVLLGIGLLVMAFVVLPSINSSMYSQ